MTWEKRKQKTYYYRKRRHGSRVISEYVSDPDLAALAAAQDQRRRQAHQAEQQALAKIRALNEEVDALCCLLQTLTHAYLLTTGFHTHKGQWRKKRLS